MNEAQPFTSTFKESSTRSSSDFFSSFYPTRRFLFLFFLCFFFLCCLVRAVSFHFRSFHQQVIHHFGCCCCFVFSLPIGVACPAVEAHGRGNLRFVQEAGVIIRSLVHRSSSRRLLLAKIAF